MKLVVLFFFILSGMSYAHHGSDHQLVIISKHINKQPTSSLLTHRASLYLKSGKRHEAIQDLQQALKINPSYSPAQKMLSGLGL